MFWNTSFEDKLSGSLQAHDVLSVLLVYSRETAGIREHGV